MAQNQSPNPIHHFETYCLKFLKIITKKAELVPLRLNAYQQRIVDVIKQQRAQGKPVRILILKSRQLGISTLISAYIYHSCATRFYQKGVLVAHDNASTGNLFSITKRFFDLSPAVVKPRKRYSNAREIVFENENELERKEEPGLMSKIEVQTAGTKTAGRSSTISHLHISELAFWSQASEALAGLLQALSKDAGSTCVIESTPQGIAGDGQEFYERWKAAEEGRSEFIPIFIPWFEAEEYRSFYPAQQLTGEEQKLKEQYGLDDYQIGWRRSVIDTDMNGSSELFAQEYPSNATDCFLRSGRSVFDLVRLAQMIEASREIKFQEGLVVS